MKHLGLVIHFLLMIVTTASLQAQNRYLHSKEGSILFRRVDEVIACVKGIHDNVDSATKIAICKCAVDLMNRNFTDEQIKRHSTNNGEDMDGLFSEDSSFARRVRDCLASNGKQAWLVYQQEYISECKKTLQEATQKPLDTARIKDFGRCQLQMVLSNELPDVEIKKLDDPNSAAFRQIVKKCGSPFKD